MDAPPAGSGARRMTVAQRMYETAPISMGGTQPGSPGGHGRTGKFSQQQRSMMDNRAAFENPMCKDNRRRRRLPPWLFHPRAPGKPNPAAPA